MRELMHVLGRLNCILCGAPGAARSGQWGEWIEPDGRRSGYAVCGACIAINGGVGEELLTAVEERILAYRKAGSVGKLSELLSDA